MMMVSLAMIVLIVMIGVIYHMITIYSEEKNINQINDLGYSLQSEIILAAEVEPGYLRVMFIPDTVGGFNFTLSQTTSVNQARSDIILKYRSSDFLFPIPKVLGTFGKGNNIIRTCPDRNITVNCSCGLCP